MLRDRRGVLSRGWAMMETNVSGARGILGFVREGVSRGAVNLLRGRNFCFVGVGGAPIRSDNCGAFCRVCSPNRLQIQALARRAAHKTRPSIVSFCPERSEVGGQKESPISVLCRPSFWLSTLDSRLT
jgi:hypothetical protein